MRRPLLPCAALLALLALAPSARAAPKTKIAFRLEYAPQPGHVEQCPDEDEMALMLAAEIGYLVVRPDAASVVRIEIQRVKKGFEAEVWAPPLTEEAEPWHGKTDVQGTCRELAYDLAALVKLRLGPRAWAGEEPPAHLRAPPEIELGRPRIDMPSPQPFESIARLAPLGIVQTSKGEEVPLYRTPSVQVELGLAFAFTPYALPSVAVGGGGFALVRWKPFAFGVDARGVITPQEGVGKVTDQGRTSLTTVSFLPCMTASFVDVCLAGSVSHMRFSGVQTSNADGIGGGIGARVMPRWQISKRFSLLAYADATAELRSLALLSDPTLAPEVPLTTWRSPSLRLTFGLGFSANLNP